MKAIRWIRKLIDEDPPLRWVLLAAAILHVVGLGWGLPGSDGWDNDGVAPRDFLPGLVDTFTPGHYTTYPPLHFAILALVTAPIWIVALLRAPSLSPPDLIAEFIHVPYMTGMALAARMVSVLLSLGIILIVADITKGLAGKRAGLLAAIVVSLNVPFTYYAHTTNLDVPYCFWALLGLRFLVYGLAEDDPRGIFPALFFAALAMATKDQAYALFLFSVPVVGALWLVRARQPRWAIARAFVVGAIAALATLLLVDGAFTNPSGFRARLAFLAGPASQSFAQYERGWSGALAALRDIGLHWKWVYPALFLLPLAVGLAATVRKRRLEGFVPLLAALSFSLAFNLVARRVEHRFVLPQSLLLAVYMGIGLDVLLRAVPKKALGVAWIATGSVLLWGLRDALTVDVRLVYDLRYEAEDFLASHSRPGDTAEIHGLNVYLPRLPEWMSTTRVGPGGSRRNPLPHVREVEDAYVNVRNRRPKWIVLGRCFVWRYTREGLWNQDGHLEPQTLTKAYEDRDAREFFTGLFNGAYPYRLVHEGRWQSRFWEPIEIHASLGCPAFVFERTD